MSAAMCLMSNALRESQGSALSWTNLGRRPGLHYRSYQRDLCTRSDIFSATLRRRVLSPLRFLAHQCQVRFLAAERHLHSGLARASANRRLALLKARTHLWGYGLTSRNRQEEFGRLLVESEGQVKDETEKQDRSPLEQQRGWRDLSEKNVMEVLERVGLVAPEGNVEKVLNTIVNNLMVTNNFDSRIRMRCRVLMTSDIEMFSMQNTIVLSRGLIDVVPNEETLAAMLAFEVADAMVPKPAQDQYGFSDILRLTPTEALKKLSFVDKPEEAQKIVRKPSRRC